MNDAQTLYVRTEIDTVHEKFLTERNPNTVALLIIVHSHNSSYKFTGWRTGRGVRRLGDKMGVFIGIYKATENVSLLTSMKPED